MRRLACLLAIFLTSPAFSQTDLRVLPPESEPEKILYRFLEGQAKKHFDARRKTVADLKTPDDIGKRQATLKAKFLEDLGGFPEKTPLNAKVVGSRGTMRAINPIAPQFFHRLRIRTGKGSRSEKFPGATSYGKQLEAFVRAVRDGAPILTDTRNAITNMELIDAVYRAAGMQPRQPTPG